MKSVMDDLRAYCDESGNTGANLLDRQQPFLIVGGWIVPESVDGTAKQHIKEYANSLKPAPLELHGARLLKTRSGLNCALGVIHGLCELHCLPVVQISEKRYFLAGRVIDIFLAPESNPLIPDTFDFTYTRKTELADKVYALPDSLLEEFSRAFQSLDKSLLASSIRNIATALSLRLETTLADLIMGSLPHVDAMIDELNAGRARLPPNTLEAPNLAAFHMFYQNLEELGRIGHVQRISIIHDDSPKYAGIMRAWLEAFRDTRKTVVRASPWRNIYFGLESVKGVVFADSKTEPLLQAADVLVSSMNRYATDVYKGERSPDRLIEIAQLLLSQLHQYPANVSMVTSRDMDNKLSVFEKHKAS
jgi:hypothetical protein